MARDGSEGVHHLNHVSDTRRRRQPQKVSNARDIHATTILKRQSCRHGSRLAAPSQPGNLVVNELDPDNDGRISLGAPSSQAELRAQTVGGRGGAETVGRLGLEPTTTRL